MGFHGGPLLRRANVMKVHELRDCLASLPAMGTVIVLDPYGIPHEVKLCPLDRHIGRYTAGATWVIYPNYHPDDINQRPHRRPRNASKPNRASTPAHRN
jgi:hypothetical protein